VARSAAHPWSSGSGYHYALDGDGKKKRLRENVGPCDNQHCPDRETENLKYLYIDTGEQYCESCWKYYLRTGAHRTKKRRPSVPRSRFSSRLADMS